MRRWVRLGVGVTFSVAVLVLLFLVLSTTRHQPATSAEASANRGAGLGTLTTQAGTWSPTVLFAVRPRTQSGGADSAAGLRTSGPPYTITGTVLDAQAVPVRGLSLELWAADGNRRLTFAKVTTGQGGGFRAVSPALAIRLRLANAVMLAPGQGSWPDPRGVLVRVGPGSLTASITVQLLAPTTTTAPSTALMPPTTLAPPLSPAPPPTAAPPITTRPTSTTIPPTTTTTGAPTTTTAVPQTRTTVAPS